MKKRWLGEGGYGEVLTIAVPMIQSMGSWSLMHFVDRMFLTWYSRDALAAALPAVPRTAPLGGGLFSGPAMPFGGSAFAVTASQKQKQRVLYVPLWDIY